jgi:hypothetical protein
MANFDADNVFIRTDTLGKVCLGGGPFEYILTCTRLGGFEVWDSLAPSGRCVAGEGYAGSSEIRIQGLTVFERDTLSTEEQEHGT